MKFCAVIFLGLVAVCLAADPVVLTPEQRQNVRAAAGACIVQEQVDKEAVQKLKVGQFENVDQKAKCFANCFLEKLGLLVNGTPQDDVIKVKLGALVGQDTINGIMQQCNSMRGADNCDTAFKLYECYFKNNVAIIQ